MRCVPATYFDATVSLVFSAEAPDLVLRGHSATQCPTSCQGRKKPGMTAKLGWARQGGAWGKKEKKLDVYAEADIAMKMTERIFYQMEEVSPAVILEKTLRIGKTIDSDNFKEELEHEAMTLGNYMIMVEGEVEELRKNVKVVMASINDPGFKSGLLRVQDMHRLMIQHSHNMKDCQTLLKPHMPDLIKHFAENCSLARVQKHLLGVFPTFSWSGISVVYEYFLYVRCCYLQLLVMLNADAENIAGVGAEFDSFNNSILQLIMFLREHEENYYLKVGLRVRM